MTQFIDAHKHEFGVEPICRTLQVAPSSYYGRQVTATVGPVGQ